MANEQRTACLILIGNELLSGRTQDKNLAYVGEGLNRHGVRLIEARVILDVKETIADTINECRQKYDFVFTTGGIGPTHDDITAESVAHAFGVPYEAHPEAMASLETHYKPEDLNDSRRKMAFMPKGARLVENPSSGAPGFAIENVYVMAGVPRIMQAMFDSLYNELGEGPETFSETLSCLLKEGTLASRLEEIQNTHQEVEIGSYPFYQGGHFGTSLVVRSVDHDAVKKAGHDISQMINALGGELID
jgi:molybdenum cofactor synthesis domain-containing protein